MTKRREPEVTGERYNPENGVTTTTVRIGDPETEADEINEYGHPVDTEKSLGELFVRLDAAMAEMTDVMPSTAEAAGIACLSPLEIDSLKAKAEHLRKIESKNQEVVALQIEHMHKAEAAKDAKKSWEAASQGLSRLISAANRIDPLLNPETNPAIKQNQEQAAGPAEEDDDWRDVGIDVLAACGLSEGIIAKLEEAALDTIGLLADWTSGKTTGKPKLLTDVAGIGPGKAEKIEQALEQFWASWAGRDRTDETPAEPAAEAVSP